MTQFQQILQTYAFNTEKHISIVFTQSEQYETCVFWKIGYIDIESKIETSEMTH